jgi:hypothetical protein
VARIYRPGRRPSANHDHVTLVCHCRFLVVRSDVIGALRRWPAPAEFLRATSREPPDDPSGSGPRRSGVASLGSFLGHVLSFGHLGARTLPELDPRCQTCSMNPLTIHSRSKSARAELSAAVIG